MPMIIGDMTAWCLYNDGKPANQRRWQSAPQGIEIRQIVFASSKPELENVVFIRYSILNTGSVAEVMDSVYFGLWEDADVGDATDDMVGCDTLLQSGYYYAKSADWQYGENPPAFFSSLLQGPLVNTNLLSDSGKINYGQQIGSKILSGTKNLRMSSHVFFIGGDPYFRDANNATEARNYLAGKNRFGEFPNPCTFAYGEVRGGVDCNLADKHFWFSGDLVANLGWISTAERDVRGNGTAGPFTLVKNQEVEILIGYEVDRSTTPLGGITAVRAISDAVQTFYENNFGYPIVSVEDELPAVVNFKLEQNYPNPFNPSTKIKFTIPSVETTRRVVFTTLKVYDILGNEVATLVNQELSPGQYEVEFNAAAFSSGIYFYKIQAGEFISVRKMVLQK